MRSLKMIDIAGVPVTAATKAEVLEYLKERLAHHQKTFMITPYSEFLYGAFMSDEVKTVLSESDVSLPDGIGMFVAESFLRLPFRSQSFHGKIFEAVGQMFFVLASIFLNKRFLYKTIPQKIVGADFFWDLIKLAHQQNKSVYFLGGFGQTPELVAEQVNKQFPGIRVAGYSNAHPGEALIRTELETHKPDILFVAYGPFTQERFIYEHLQKLPVTMAIGVGGTFDYIVGNKPKPPKLVRSFGLEWLYRLLTQRNRSKRVYNATIGMIRALIRYKVYESMPFRKNAVIIIFRDQKILVCRRKPMDDKQFGVTFGDYWQFPQGGLEAGEDAITGALREVQEETGIRSARAIGISAQTYSYHWRNGRRSLLSHPFMRKYRYKGQSQSIVFVQFTGNESEIILDNREFVDYKWVSLDQLEFALHSERREMFKNIEPELTHVLKYKQLPKV